MSEAANYQVLARKYRPKRFSELVGQEHLVRALSNALKSGRLAHAYLFVGPRGIGKTSTARIFAMALNATGGPRADFDPEGDPICQAIAEGRCLDVREIDGASNRGIDQIRELRDDVRYAPQQAKFKIYVVDEVHMLTKEAFNALLKTLEEPPEHAKFIFATTEGHQVPATILSRCQRFDLHRISAALIAKQLAVIAEKEGITVEPSALEALARFADGGMRDAQSALDQLIAFCGKTIKASDAEEMFGLPPQEAIAGVSDALMRGDSSRILHLIADLGRAGRDLNRLLPDVLAYLRNILIAQRAPGVLDAELGGEAAALVASHADTLSPSKLLRLVEFLAPLEGSMRYSLAPRVQLEVSLVSAAESTLEVELDDVLRLLRGLPPSEPIHPVRPVMEAPPASLVPEPQVKIPLVDVLPPETLVSHSPAKSPDPEPPQPFPPAVLDPVPLAPAVSKVTQPVEVEPPLKKAVPASPTKTELDAFRDDPLIQEALEKLGARLVEIKKS